MCANTPDTPLKPSMEAHCGSRLLDLPPELRNIIYEYAVIDTQNIDITSEQQPGIIRTCSETRSECRQMYYTRNTFTFSPSTRDDKDALRPLEQWLMQIGHKNCRALRKLIIILNGDTGLLINEPKSTADPWASLVHQMDAAGCVPSTRLRTKLHEDIFPRDGILEDGVAALGSKQKLLAVVQERRETMQLAIATYVKLLRLQQLDTVAFKDWEAKEFPTVDLAGLVKETVYAYDATWFWIHDKMAQLREDFPLEEFKEGLERCAKHFQGYFALFDVE